MDVTEEIKARIDIVDLISETVQLRKAGSSYSGMCPFHDNKRTPAFAVFPDSGTWRCFGQCNEGGDIFSFVMKKEGWDFKETLEHLAKRAGVELRPQTPHQQARNEQTDRLRDLLEAVVVFYRHQLRNTAAGADALRYLHDRGLDDETIDTWGVGYAQDSFEITLNHLTEKDFTRDEILAAGMVSQRDNGHIFDRFRDRVTFAIRDERGRMTGFGARALRKDQVPKYLNSPQTILFDKGRMLYGLDRARSPIREANQVVIVEGYMDVIVPHMHGFTNLVSPMGTALTEDHLRLLKRRSRNIILALDPDAAGSRATMRGLEIARETMDRKQEVTLDARGLIRHEGAIDADIRVAILPEGLDPDEIVIQDPQQWQAIITNAKPIITHVMETLAIGKNRSDPKVKSEIAAQVMSLIDDVGNAIERDTYRQHLARFLRIDEHTLLQSVARPSKQKRRTRSQPTPQENNSQPTRKTPLSSLAQTLQKTEKHCIAILLRRPQYVYRLDRALQTTGLVRLSVRDFTTGEHQTLFKVISSALEQDFSHPLNMILASIPLALMPRVEELIAQTENLPTDDERVLDDLMQSFIRLRRMQVDQHIERGRFQIESNGTNGTNGSSTIDPLVSIKSFNEERRKLDQALNLCRTSALFSNRHGLEDDR